MGTYTKNLFKKRREQKAAAAAEPKFDDAPVGEEVVETTGDAVHIKLWVDDTRPPSCDPYNGDGWTWVKSYREAVDLFDENENYVVTHLALDYRMDYHMSGAPTGDVIAHELIMRMHYLDRPQVFGSVVRVNCHSSDRDYRIKTATVIKEAQDEGYLNKDARVSIHQAKNGDTF